jgi:hypothetical protein
LIHSTPSTNVEQSIGRIQRQLVGKSTPIVMDLIDTEGPKVNSYKDKNKKVTWFLRAAEKRIEVFEKKNWNMEIIRLGEN